jgi:hypothetical protein
VIPRSGQNIFTKCLRSKTLSSTSSHFSFISLHGSFGIFHRGIIVTFNIGSFLSVKEFSFGNFPSGCTITIAWSLRLKQQFYQLVCDLRSPVSTKSTTYSRGVGRLKSTKGLMQVMWFPPPPQESPLQLSQVLENILEDSSVAGGGQLVEVAQLLTPFVVQHA